MAPDILSSGQFHDPAGLPSGKEPPVPFELGALWGSKSSSGYFGEEKVPCSCQQPNHISSIV
jgi:hypothetical protein